MTSSSTPSTLFEPPVAAASADVAAFAEPRAPEYPWGLRVVALDDLLNDGSHPEQPAGAVLAAQGSVGEIVKIGHSMESNEPVYLVEFGRCVVGCFEEEIAPAPPGLLPETPETPATGGEDCR